jgi:hypothetical protein
MIRSSVARIGHLPDTPLPWSTGNSALAAHRDTLFRPLRGVRLGDVLRLKTPHGDFDYVVRETMIVGARRTVGTRSHIGVDAYLDQLLSVQLHRQCPEAIYRASRADADADTRPNNHEGMGASIKSGYSVIDDFPMCGRASLSTREPPSRAQGIATSSAKVASTSQGQVVATATQPSSLHGADTLERLSPRQASSGKNEPRPALGRRATARISWYATCSLTLGPSALTTAFDLQRLQHPRQQQEIHGQINPTIEDRQEQEHRTQ